MDHLHHNHHHQSNQAHHPLHWNYTSSTPISAPITSTPISHNANNANTWTPPTTRGIKRAMSESDCEDIYSEESSKEQ
jgi:YRPW motif-containing protein